MATSESDADFESADEEIGRGASVRRDINKTTTFRAVPSTVDSESDDDTDCMQYTPRSSSDLQRRCETSWTAVSFDTTASLKKTVGDKDDNIDNNVKVESNLHVKSAECVNTSNVQENVSPIESERSPLSILKIAAVEPKDIDHATASSKTAKSGDDVSKAEVTKSEKIPRPSRQNPSRQLGARKLGARIMKDDADKSHVTDNVITEQKDERLTESSNKGSTHLEEKDTECKLYGKSDNQLTDDQSKSHRTDDLPETDMPDELKSDKKFKEVFQPEGWEGLGNDIELPDELTEEKLQPVLEKLSLATRGSGSFLGGWSNWGNWGVTSLINTATAGVSTLTTHVSQGFTLLEETIGTPDPADSTDPADSIEVTETQRDEVTTPDDVKLMDIEERENLSYSLVGFGNMSGVSSITKLVELTGSKVITGGLNTLEAIGKKTMEVLQDGDPGLKKKRAFFMNETNKPILSQVLREAKEKAESEKKTIEERELARKVHFESLFDDYQGLVHLEALEILSRQSNMKIQQHLIELDTDELTSIQETLEEIKELCDLGDEEDKNEDFENRLKAACDDLGVDITYEKLYSMWTETKDYLASSSTYTEQEIFQRAISILARFTALSVERFHKTAELLLIKERRSTVNEADALVQLTNVLSDQISSLANLFCDTLNRFAETLEKPDNVNANITTIFVEAANANSYIQDAFRLFIPILQVGAI